MRHSVGLLSLLACVGSLVAVQYGEYSPLMPQYDERHDGGDSAAVSEEYSDRSLERAAGLDYKYEEDTHDKSEVGSIKEGDEDRMWNKPPEKIRKSSFSRNSHVYSPDKDTFDDVPEFKSKDRLLKHRSRFRNKHFDSAAPMRLKPNSIDQSDDTDNVENKDYYVEREEETDRGEEFDESSNPPRKRLVTKKKARRKPRDRAHHRHHSDDGEHSEFQDDTRYRADQFLRNKDILRKPRPISELIDINRPNKQSNEYDDYYDMKPIQNIKERIPSLYRQTTVKTTGQQSIRDIEIWLKRRGISSVESDKQNKTTPTTTSTTSPTYNVSTSETPASVSTSIVNTTELSLADKSRLSILRKVLRKEDGSLLVSKKPPVLLQVATRMHTVVMVEPPVTRKGRGARYRILEGIESPKKLERARSLMRKKIVSNARNIQELTDNWDEMVCDYIDVSLLNSGSFIQLNKLLATSVICVWISYVYLYF